MSASSVRWSAGSMALAALFFGLSLDSMPARAAVSVQVDAASVQVVASHATVSEVLNALGRILRGYNYAIKTHDAAIHVIAISKAGNLRVGSGASPVEVAPAQSATPPNINLETMASRRNR